MSVDTSTSLRIGREQSRARWMVADSAIILKRFYFLYRELVLMQAGWMPGTTHFQTKILLPEHLWQDSLVARELRQRVLELRYPEREIEVPPDGKLLQCWRKLADAPHGEAFAQGLWRVVKPMLGRCLERYLTTTDHLDDGPTLRLVHQALRDIRQQVEQGQAAQQDAVRAYPEQVASIQRWLAGIEPIVSQLEKMLLEPGASQPLPDFEPVSAGGNPFELSRKGARDRRFHPILFPWPDALDPAAGPGEGLRLQVRQACHHLNEVWAAEMAAACLYELAPKGPHEFLVDAARWCYDEIRHCRMGYERFLEWGFAMEQMPVGSFSYDAGAHTDALTRLGIIFYFESTYIHTKSQRMRIFGEYGDKVSSHDMDFDWADEQIHAHYGTHWLRYFMDQQGDSRRPVDFRPQAEACIQAIRRQATVEDRRQTQELFERTMALAQKLANPA